MCSLVSWCYLRLTVICREVCDWLRRYSEKVDNVKEYVVELL